MRGDWQTVKLGEVCSFFRGLTYKKSSEVELSDNVVLRANNISLGSGLLNFDELKYIADEIDIPDSKKIKRGSLLICTASGSKKHLGKTAYIDVDDDYAFGGFMGMLAPQSGLVDGRFLFHLMNSKSYSDFIAGLSDGANINNLKFSQLCEFQIPLPPLPEQERIVSILDKAFEGIDKAIAQTEQNLASARELFESYLNNLFTQKGEDWVETTVKDLVEDGLLEKPLDGNHGEIHPKKADFVDEGIPFIMASDLQKGEVNQLDCNHIKKEQAETLRKGFSKQDDVLMSHKGTIGRVAILNTAHDYIVLTPQVTYYRIIQPERLYNRFVYYYFQSPLFQRYIKYAAGAGSTRAYIGITKQLDLPMAYPSLARQKEIVGILDLASGTSQQLEALYTQKLNDLKELKQSLLQQAFAGELTKEDAA